MIEKITWHGWIGGSNQFSSCCITGIGEVIKETPKQIRFQANTVSGAGLDLESIEFVTNKSKIVRREKIEGGNESCQTK